MKRAIVIGASSGLGRRIALILLQQGWHVGIAARRLEALEEVRNTCPERVKTARIDVTAADAPERLRELVDSMGGMELYFHVSGIGKQNIRLNADVETATVETNALGFTRMVNAAFNYLATHGGGHIAVISSIAGTKGLGPAPSYSATKAFQSTYIQALEQLANSRRLPISFTDVRPGFVDTPLLAGSRYPMLLDAEKAAREIVRAVNSRRHVWIVDWKYRILTFCWRLLPNCVWRRLRLVKTE